MSSQKQEAVKRIAAPDIRARKGGEPIVCLTAYDAPTAALLDDHCDLLLVGDSVGMVVHGMPNTVGVTLEMMILHGQAVMRGSRRAMVVIDMPFGSYEGGKEQAYQNCARVMKETGAQGVKVESGPTVAETIAYLVQRGIPVMGHVGLRPQAVLTDGAFKAKGKTDEERLRVMSEAEATAVRRPSASGPGRFAVGSSRMSIFDGAPRVDIARAMATAVRSLIARPPTGMRTLMS